MFSNPVVRSSLPVIHLGEVAIAVWVWATEFRHKWISVSTSGEKKCLDYSLNGCVSGSLLRRGVPNIDQERIVIQSSSSSILWLFPLCCRVRLPASTEITMSSCFLTIWILSTNGAHMAKLSQKEGAFQGRPWRGNLPCQQASYFLYCSRNIKAYVDLNWSTHVAKLQHGCSLPALFRTEKVEFESMFIKETLFRLHWELSLVTTWLNWLSSEILYHTLRWQHYITQ
jgi:hypothetical protein